MTCNCTYLCSYTKKKVENLNSGLLQFLKSSLCVFKINEMCLVCCFFTTASLSSAPLPAAAPPPPPSSVHILTTWSRDAVCVRIPLCQSVSSVPNIDNAYPSHWTHTCHDLYLPTRLHRRNTLEQKDLHNCTGSKNVP